jgi:hypothetical protein
MVLSSCKDDFAGWALKVASPFRDLMEIEPLSERRIRQSAAPDLDATCESHFTETGLAKTGLAEPHGGKHRWWQLGTCGALICAILAVAFFSLAHRDRLLDIVEGFAAAPRATALPSENIEPSKVIQPALISAAREP